jgi:hypothetical protein
MSGEKGVSNTTYSTKSAICSSPTATEELQVFSPLNIKTDQPLVVKETAKGWFDILLPECDASVLPKVLDASAPWVTLMGFSSNEADMWVEQHLRPLFDPVHRMESVHVKRLEMDVTLPRLDFLRLLSFFSDRGVDLVQSARVLPSRLSVGELRPDSKARVFRDVGIVLQFYLPHPHEHALVGSPSMEELERIAAAFKK